MLKRFRPYFVYLKPVRVQFVLGLVAGILAAAASGAGLPFVIKFVVPLITGDEAPTGLALLAFLSIIPLAFAVRAIGTFVNAYFMTYAGMHVLEQLRLEVFKKLQQLPLGFFHGNRVGDLMSRIMSDTTQLQAALVRVVNSLVRDPATLLSAAGFLIYLSIGESEILFLLIALASAPGCVFPIRYVGKRIRKKAKLAQTEAGRINTVLNENLGSLREVRSYNLQDKEVGRFADTCRSFLRYQMKTVKYDKSLTPLIEFVTSLALVLALYVAVAKDIRPENIAAIVTALYMCYDPVKKLGAVSNILRKAEASLDRLEFILHSEDAVPEHPGARPLETVEGRIDFRKVQFRYTDEVVLRDIDVTIEPGQTVALVGPSGAGKSTFANLVPRFYDAVEGSVHIDGIDVREVRKADLRQQIALVSQEAILFGDTIANNIRIGRPEASLEQVKEAARLANAHDFIEALDEGYETDVGERGSRLSGGQRQRISIARAFLKDAPIIILDEPTSALDAESEHAIQDALETLAEGRTVLIIAHRFSTIQHAHRILVFDAGTIVDAGRHTELHARCPLYRSLYNKQAKTALETQT